MNKNRSVKLNSLIAVQTLLADNHELIVTLPAFDEAYDLLGGFVTDINTNLKVQSSPSGAVEAKAEAFTALGDTAFEIAGAVLSFAEKNSDRQLAVEKRLRWEKRVSSASPCELRSFRRRPMPEPSVGTFLNIGSFVV